MNRTEFHQHMSDTFAEALEISRRKNADYAGAGDPFANFRIVENMGLVSTEQGILVRMSDKFARITNLLDRPAQVTDESIDDTLSDLINYAAILKAYLYDRRRVHATTRTGAPAEDPAAFTTHRFSGDEAASPAA